MNLFDEKRIYVMRKQAATRVPAFFLYQIIQKDIIKRLQFFNLKDKKVLIVGIHSNIIVQDLTKICQLTFLNANVNTNDAFHTSDQTLNFNNQSFDVIIDILQFHTLNNLVLRLREYQRCLKTKGNLFIIFFGGQTLCEFRNALIQADLIVSHGAALRVIPMLEFSAFVNLCQRTGLQNFVVDFEKITMLYQNFKDIAQDIRLMGEHQPFIAKPQSLTRQKWRHAELFYKQNYFDRPQGKLTSTIEVIYLRSQILK